MRRSNKTGKRQNSNVLGVGVSIDEMRFIKELINDLAARRNDLGYAYKPVPEGRRAIETSSLEAYVSGKVAMADSANDVITQYSTGYMFTCCKVKGGDYTLTWMSSLS
jgi:hypothetical protein